MSSPIVVPDQVRDAVRGQLTQTLQQRLAPGQPLTADLQRLVQQKADEAISLLTDRNVSKDAMRIAKDNLRGQVNLQQTVQQRLANALEGVQAIGNDAQMNQILQANATMLFRKMQALQAAGFSPDQAFNLILAEVTNRKQ